MTLRSVHSEEHLLTRAELAELLHCDVQTIDKMRDDGLPTITWGRRYLRFRPSAVMAWLETHEQEAA
jgi:excisionase family DNA binding protein